VAKTGYANYKVPALTGKGTIKDTAISVAGSYAGALIDADGSTDVINIEGSTSINMVQPGYIYAKNSGTINVKNMLTVTGSASNGLTVELETGSKFNVLSGAKYTYKAPAPWSYFKVKNSTLTFDGPIVATNLSKNPYHAIELWHNSSLYLNSDNNIIDAEGSGLYAMAYGNGGRIEINGTTTILKVICLK